MNELQTENHVDVIEKPPFSTHVFGGYDRIGMRNLNAEIDIGLAEKLKTEKYIAQYSAINFIGYVWWNKSKKRYACTILQFHREIETIYCKTLREIMRVACSKYGYE